MRSKRVWLKASLVVGIVVVAATASMSTASAKTHPSRHGATVREAGPSGPASKRGQLKGFVTMSAMTSSNTPTSMRATSRIR
jgi:hypothetical protein